MFLFNFIGFNLTFYSPKEVTTKCAYITRCDHALYVHHCGTTYICAYTPSTLQILQDPCFGFL